MPPFIPFNFFVRFDYSVPHVSAVDGLFCRLVYLHAKHMLSSRFSGMHCSRLVCGGFVRLDSTKTSLTILFFLQEQTTSATSRLNYHHTITEAVPRHRELGLLHHWRRTPMGKVWLLPYLDLEQKNLYLRILLVAISWLACFYR